MKKSYTRFLDANVFIYAYYKLKLGLTEEQRKQRTSSRGLAKGGESSNHSRSPIRGLKHLEESPTFFRPPAISDRSLLFRQRAYSRSV